MSPAGRVVSEQETSGSTHSRTQEAIHSLRKERGYYKVSRSKIITMESSFIVQQAIVKQKGARSPSPNSNA